MQVLVDESLPVELADALELERIHTVAQVGLRGFKNGALLEQAEVRGFTVLLTADQSLQFQQDLAGRSLSVVVLCARSNRMQHLRPLLPSVRQAIAMIGPGQVIRIS